jgi:hypothetical protein
MGKLTYPSLMMLVAVTTPAAAQTSNPIFLDCDTVSEYVVPNKGQVVRKTLHFKLDFVNSDVLELNADKGVYVSWCRDPEKNEKLRDKGNCIITDDMIYATVTKPISIITALDDLTFYRQTGKIKGSRKSYLDTTRDFIEFMQKQPLVDYRIDGTCQQGVDLSSAKRAF